MRLVETLSSRANCTGRHVGSVLVLSDRVISTGYNGTPDGTTNCDDGGCHRCAKPEVFKRGSHYDICICVHAEQNALLTAARHGVPVKGSVIYTTLRPCFGCTKELLQALVCKVFYRDEWTPTDASLWSEYTKLQGWIEDGIQQLGNGSIVHPPEETGHSIPAE
jgi:dCMP deaminase